VKAQTKATTQPTNVQPKKKFKINIAQPFCFFQKNATNDGKKYRNIKENTKNTPQIATPVSIFDLFLLRFFIYPKG